MSRPVLLVFTRGRFLQKPKAFLHPHTTAMPAMHFLFSIETPWCERIPHDTFHLAAHYIRRLSYSYSVSKMDVSYLLNIANKFLHDMSLDLPEFVNHSAMKKRMCEGALLEKLVWKLHHRTRYDMVCEHVSHMELSAHTLSRLRDSEHEYVSDEKAAKSICKHIDVSLTSPPPSVLKKRRRPKD